MKKGLLFLWLVPAVVTAQLQVAKIFSNNMVLQRNQALRIWGKAWAFEKVTVAFDGKTATVVSRADSIGTVSFPNAVYYDCKPFTDANLVNAERLPAFTFKLKVP